MAIEVHYWVADFAGMLSFYRDKLGFELTNTNPQDNPTWCMLTFEGQSIMLATVGTGEPSHPTQAYQSIARERIGKAGAVSIYFSVNDVDVLHQRCEEQGVEIIEPIWNPFWGGRQFTISDPEGNWSTFAGEASA